MRITIVVGVLLGLMVGAACAADAPKVTLDANALPMDQVMTDLGKQAGVQIMCETGITSTVTGGFASVELEKLLDTITKANSLKWQKVYLPAPGDQKPTLAQVKARADAVAAVTGGPIIVCDAVTGKQKVFVEQDTATPSVDPEKLGLKLVYLVSKPKAEVKATQPADQDTLKRFQSVQQERMKLMSEMTAEQRISAMQQETVSMMQLDPTVRAQMMIDQVVAMRTMDPQMRTQFHDTMRDAMRTARDQGLIPAGDRQWGQGGRGGGQHNHDNGQQGQGAN